MELLYSVCVGVMTFSGVFLCLRGRTFPVVMGLMMLGYAVNSVSYTHLTLPTNREV